MATMAIIGADGAGKTTVAKTLAATAPMRVKYIYMGTNIESSNVALPTSRLMLRFKFWVYTRRAEREGITDKSYVSTHHEAHRSVRYGPVMSVLRTANKLAEAMYRQLVSWTYQRRGYIVIYDRHFIFEAALGGTKGARVGDRAYLWALTRFYPRPDLTVFLDAPPEVLLQRKGEDTLKILAQRRESYVEEGRKTAQFFVVDANRRLDDVVDEVGRHLATLRSERNSTDSTR